MLPGYVAPLHVPRYCDKCKKETERRCACGEVFCSHRCLKDGWANHKDICETVRDSHPLLEKIKRMYWAGCS